jgi:hypothetical protein
MNTVPQLKAIGNLIKTEVIEVTGIHIDNFFKNALKDELTLSEILYEWEEEFKNEHIILLPINAYKSQINLIADSLPDIFEIELNGEKYEFLFLSIVDKLEINSLKNIEELSGVGQILTTFELKFEDFPKKFTKSNNINFFNLADNGIILNSVRLTIDEAPVKLKLTGRAAEIARKKGKI